MQEDGEQHVRVERLGEKVVHAGLQAMATILGKRVGGHRQDRRCRVAGSGADQARRDQAVQARHLHVHQDQRVVRFLHAAERILAIRRGVDAQPRLFEQETCDFEIDRFVVDDKDAAALVAGDELKFGILAARFRCAFVLVATDLQTRREPEDAAGTGQSIDADLAAHQFGQAARDGEAETGAAVLARRRVVRLFEGVEEARQGVGRDADAAVAYFEAHAHLAFAFVEEAGAQDDVAGFGEFHGVHRVIEQRLLQAHRVAAQRGGELGALDVEPQSLGPRAFGDDGADRVEQVADVDRCVVEREFAGLDLRDVENVVDDSEQVAGRGVDRLQAFGLSGRHALAAQDVDHADDAVQRRADLVAHVGEESALGDIVCGECSRSAALEQIGDVRRQDFVVAAAEEDLGRRQQLIDAGRVRRQVAPAAVVSEDEIGDGADQRLVFGFAGAQRVAGQPDDRSACHHFLDRIGHQLACFRIDDVEDLRQLQSARLVDRPSGHLFGGEVHARNPSGGIGGDDGVPDRMQRDGEVFFAQALFFRADFALRERGCQVGTHALECGRQVADFIVACPHQRSLTTRAVDRSTRPTGSPSK